jgi:hypothetical protein
LKIIANRNVMSLNEMTKFTASSTAGGAGRRPEKSSPSAANHAPIIKDRKPTLTTRAKIRNVHE